jgi:hypothetical protein
MPGIKSSRIILLTSNFNPFNVSIYFVFKTKVI